MQATSTGGSTTVGGGALASSLLEKVEKRGGSGGCTKMERAIRCWGEGGLPLSVDKGFGVRSDLGPKGGGPKSLVDSLLTSRPHVWKQALMIKNGILFLSAYVNPWGSGQGPVVLGMRTWLFTPSPCTGPTNRLFERGDQGRSQLVNAYELLTAWIAHGRDCMDGAGCTDSTVSCFDYVVGEGALDSSVIGLGPFWPRGGPRSRRVGL